MTNKLFKDLQFGFDSEKEVEEILVSLWLNVTRTEDVAILDYIITDCNNNRINIELKTRRNKSTDYPSTMIGANKLGEAYNNFYKNGIITLFLFKFTDGIYYLNPFEQSSDVIEYKAWRWDRGSLDWKKGWLYYNIEHLKQIVINT